MSNFAPNPSATNQPSPQRVNPYAVTATDITPTLGGDAESIRRRYIGHEASVKSVGTFSFLVSVFLGFMASVYGWGGANILFSGDPEEQMMLVTALVLTIVCACAAALYCFAASGLWRLKPWSRLLATMLACFGLLLVPIGTILNGYCLYVLLCERANVIFSEAYQDVIAQTPHIKYRTSTLAWIVLGIFILLVLVAIVAALLPAVT